MICIDTATYSESVIWTPNFGSGASRGPMQKAMTYIVRPDIAPRYCSVMTVFISRGSIQLFVGPASSRDWEQMNVLSSTRATSSGSETHRNEFGLRSRRTNVPLSTSRSVRRSHSAPDPSHQITSRGEVRSSTSATQAAMSARSAPRRIGSESIWVVTVFS